MRVIELTKNNFINSGDTCIFSNANQVHNKYLKKKKLKRILAWRLIKNARNEKSDSKKRNDTGSQVYKHIRVCIGYMYKAVPRNGCHDNYLKI